MRDAHGRVLDYMRVSITDRCNLRCTYCMPHELPFLSHDDILRYEEILRVCRAMAKLGVKTVRITGGEPLMRKGCVDLIRELKAVPGIEHVTLTTNAVLLEPYIDELAALKLGGLNISLDSLSAEGYQKITGQDVFHQVWKALNRAVETGIRVKINCVAIRGKNEGEILSLVRLAETMPIDVRFIELMPADEGDAMEGISGEEISGVLLGAYPDLTPDPSKRGFGPARYFKSEKLKGGIGLIDAISNHFCADCNRLRLTSQGFLKLCLHHGDGLDLRAMLRGGVGDVEIETAIAEAAFAKPARHCFDQSTSGIQKMSQIGG
ncbi:MAG: GTP 3',8-cyclase MoaA [Oscillospiraceae bacterium]|nr:GTP 3',8-cyclase MoaA [Oscillospiraceae bacterium]